MPEDIMDEEDILLGHWINEPELENEDCFETPQKISTGKEERDTVDGIEFLSFRTQKDMDEFTRIEQDYKGISAPVDDGFDFSYDETGYRSLHANYPPSTSSCSSSYQSRPQANEEADDGFESCGVRGIYDDNSVDFNWLSDSFPPTTRPSSSATSSTFVPIATLPPSTDSARPIMVKATPAIQPVVPPIKIKLSNNMLQVSHSPPTGRGISFQTAMSSFKEFVNSLPSTSKTPTKRRLFEDLNEKPRKIPRTQITKKRVPLPKDLDKNYDFIMNGGRIIRLTGSSKNIHYPKSGRKVIEIYSNKDFIVKNTQNKEKEKERKKPIGPKSLELKAKGMQADDTEIYLNLYIKPELGKTLSNFGLKALKIYRADNDRITPSWALFAASNVVLAQKRPRGRKPKIQLPPAPIPPGKELRFTVLANELNLDLTLNYEEILLEDTVRNIVNDLVIAVDISLNHPKEQFDPDQSPPEIEKEQEENIEDNAKMIKPQKTTTKNLRLELKRLNADLIFMPEEDNQKNIEENKECVSLSCRLGCVCSSLNYKRPQFLEHCGQKECLFECVCKEHKSTSMNRLTLLSGTSNFPSTLTTTTTTATKLLAPLEKEFKQTVIFNDNSTMVVGRRKREIKLPERYRDSVLGREFALSELKMLAGNTYEEGMEGKACIVPQYVPVDMFFSQKQSSSITNQYLLKYYKIKPSKCVLAHDSRLNSLWAWCMDHNRYGCSCIKYRPAKHLPADLETRPGIFKYENYKKTNTYLNIPGRVSKSIENNNIYDFYEDIERKEVERSQENSRQVAMKSCTPFEITSLTSCARTQLMKIDFRKRNSCQQFRALSHQRIFNSKNYFKPIILQNISHEGDISVDEDTEEIICTSEPTFPIPIKKIKDEKLDVYETSSSAPQMTTEINYVKINFLPHCNELLKNIFTLTVLFQLDESYDSLHEFRKKNEYVLLSWEALLTVIHAKIYHLWKAFFQQQRDILILTKQSNLSTNPLMVNLFDWIPDILPFPPKEYFQLRNENIVGINTRRFVILSEFKSEEVNGFRVLGYMDVDPVLYDETLLNRYSKIRQEIKKALERELSKLGNLNDNIVQSRINNEVFFHVPLPNVKVRCRWYMLSLYQDFSLLILRNYSHAISFNELNRAIVIATNSNRTIRIPVGGKKNIEKDSPLFGIYAIPRLFTRIFIGPYNLDEESFVELYTSKDGHYKRIPPTKPIFFKNRVDTPSSLDIRIENNLSLLGKSSKSSIGTWLYTSPGQPSRLNLPSRNVIQAHNPYQVTPKQKGIKRKLNASFPSNLPKKTLIINKFKRMIIYPIRWPQVGYFEARLYDNITYRMIHPETQVELRFTGHQNLFLWLNMFLKMENDPLEWGIQNLPRKKPDIEPFDLKRYQRLRELYLKEKDKASKKVIPAKESPVPSKPDLLNDSKSSLSISDLSSHKISSILDVRASTSSLIATTTTSPTLTTTTSTSTTATIVPVAPSTSSSKTLSSSSSSLSITSIFSSPPRPPPPSSPRPPSSPPSPPAQSSSLLTLLTASNETPSNATSTPAKTSQQENKKERQEEKETPLNELLAMMEKMIPIKKDDDKMIDMIIKLNETILEEEEKESDLLKTRLALYHERQMNILKLYRLMNTLDKSSIDEPMECLKEIFRIKIPKIRFPTATKESMVIQKQLLNLLYEIDPKSVPKNLMRKDLIANLRGRSESPSVSISVVPINEAEIKSSSETTITSDSGKTSDNSSSLIITPAFTPNKNTNAQSTIEIPSAIKKEDDDITVTYISSVSSKKDEKSIPVFDLTVFSDDEEANDEENTNIMVEKLEKKFSNNEVSINVSNVAPKTLVNTSSILRNNLLTSDKDKQQPDLNIEVVKPTNIASNESVIPERTKKDQQIKTTKLTLKNLNSGGLTISVQPNSQSNANVISTTAAPSSSLSTIKFSQIRSLTAKNPLLKKAFPPPLAYLSHLKSQRITSTVTSSHISQTQTLAQSSNSTTTSTATRAPILVSRTQLEQNKKIMINTSQCPPKISNPPNSQNSTNAFKKVMVFKDQKGTPYYVPFYTNPSNKPISKISIPSTKNVNQIPKSPNLLANSKIVPAKRLATNPDKLPIKIVPSNDSIIKQMSVQQLLEIQNAISKKKMPNISPATSTQLLTKLTKAINWHCQLKSKNFISSNPTSIMAPTQPKSTSAKTTATATATAPPQPQAQSTSVKITPVESTTSTSSSTSLPTVSLSSSAPLIKLKASSPLLAGKLLTLSTSGLSPTSTKFLTTISQTKLTPLAATSSTAANSENKNTIPIKITSCPKKDESEKNKEET